MRFRVEETAAASGDGWWTLAQGGYGDRHVIRLPTFMIPAETRRGDAVFASREGGPEGYWRVRRVRHRTRLMTR